MYFEEAILHHNEVGEPNLTYWNPNPNPVENFNEFLPSEQLNGTTSYTETPSFEYTLPLPDIVHSYVQDQQVRFNGPTESYRKSYVGVRRMPRQPQFNPDGLLSAISGQAHQAMMNDRLMHEEVIKAAKTLFSKRNRTLLSWLNPGVSKNQIKINVNEAWESLPAAEKVFYISQVLGKFAPHTTSLMVNPQLSSEGLSMVESAQSSTKRTENNVNLQSNSEHSTSDNTKCTCKKHPRKRCERIGKKIKVEPPSDDDVISNSELVTEEDSKDGCQEQMKPKRKYKKRKSKQSDKESEGENKLSLTSEESKPVVTKIDEETPIASFTEEMQTNKNGEKKTKELTTDSGSVPKVKRAYIKRKLERKKYTRREKIKDVSKTSEQPLIAENPAPCQSSGQTSNTLDDMDVFIELDEDALFEGVETLELLNEDVDSFWDNCEDPARFFDELELN